MFVLLVSKAKQSLPRPLSSCRLPTAPSGSFMVSSLVSKTLTHFKFIFAGGVTHGSNVTLLHVALRCSRRLLLESLAFPRGVLGSPVRQRLTVLILSSESSWKLVLGHGPPAAWPPLLVAPQRSLTCRMSFGGLRTPGAAPPPSRLLRARTKHGTAGEAWSIPRRGTEPASGRSSLYPISSPGCLEPRSPTFWHRGRRSGGALTPGDLRRS